MGIGEAHAFSGEAVEVWSGDLALRIVGAHVAEPQIIGEHDDDVGFFRGGCGKGDEGNENGETAHGWRGGYCFRRGGAGSLRGERSVAREVKVRGAADCAGARLCGGRIRLMVVR